MSNTRKKHSFMQQQKLEEQNRLTSTILMFIVVAVFIVAVVKLGPLDTTDISVVSYEENQVMEASLFRDTEIEVKVIGQDGTLIRVEILNFDKRKKYKLDLGDGKILRVKSQFIDYRYTSNGFYDINLTETKNGRVKELSKNTITITKGA